MIREAANAAFLLFLVFGLMLWVHRFDAMRHWKAFGEAIRDVNRELP